MTPSRPLDTIERFWFVRGLNGGAICVGAALVEGPLDREIARAAADLLRREHPILDACIAGEHGPHFAPGTFTTPLRVVEGPDWHSVFEDEIQHRFDAAGGPLWRIVVVLAPNGPHAVICAAHHAFIDGHSQLRLVEDFVDHCRDRVAGRNAPHAVEPPAPLDRLLEMTPGKARPGPRGPLIFPIEGRAPAEARRTCFLRQDLDAGRHGRIRERVKRERTTIHAALCGAVLFAAQRLVGPFEGFHLISPVSLRALCRPQVPDDKISCHSSGTTLVANMRGPADFWERVRGLHRELLSAIGAQQWRLDPLASPEQIDAARCQNAAHAANPEWQGRVGDMVISSAGDVDPRRNRAPFRIVGYYETGSQHVTGHHFGLWPHGVGDALCLTLGYVAPITTPAYAETLFAAIIESLEAAV